jgi:uncharacterized protein YecE (DUF72 family)
MAGGIVRVGVGGWTYEPWRGVFFPKGLSHKEELAYASRHLTSIEINGTFYRTQSPSTFQKWHDETPEDFVFAVKAPRYVTHRRALSEAGEAVQIFMKSGVEVLGRKLGPINWQLPETRKFDAEDFEQFLKLLPTGFLHAVELRHETFKCEECVSLARSYGVAIVLSGDSKHPLIPDPTAPFAYVRIMGTEEGEALGYPEDRLDAWAHRVKELATGNEPTGLPLVSSEPVERKDRDVFLYVISGFKQANPSAAMAIIDRI